MDTEYKNLYVEFLIFGDNVVKGDLIASKSKKGSYAYSVGHVVSDDEIPCKIRLSIQENKTHFWLAYRSTDNFVKDGIMHLRILITSTGKN